MTPVTEVMMPRWYTSTTIPASMMPHLVTNSFLPSSSRTSPSNLAV